MATAHLLRLPQELIIRVSSFLTTVELGLFRRSCKEIETSLFESFAKEFFTKRQFMLEQNSLEALVDIANHPTLSSKLKEVIISLHSYQTDEEISRRLYLAGHVDHHVLIATGQAHDMLKEAFSKLPNLGTVGLRDYDGAGRFRDGSNARWRSYGWSIAPGRGTGTGSIELIFPLILTALGSAKSRPKALEVFLRRLPQLNKHAMELPRVGTVADGMNSMLASLETVMLAFWIDDPEFGRADNTYHNSNMTENSTRNFLHRVSNVKSLRLNFRYDESFAQRLLDWLGRDVVQPVSDVLNGPAVLPIPTVQLAHLSRLDIGMANTPVSTLLKVLSKWNLKSFSLWKIALHASDLKENAWAMLLDQLATTLPLATRLRSIMIGYPTSMVPDPARYLYSTTTPVTFNPPCCPIDGHETAPGAAVVKYEGQFTAVSPHQWLEELAKSSRLLEARSPSTTDSQSVESIDIDDEDNDEDEDEDVEEEN